MPVKYLPFKPAGLVRGLQPRLPHVPARRFAPVEALPAVLLAAGVAIEMPHACVKLTSKSQ
jgi:hypothetical protein